MVTYHPNTVDLQSDWDNQYSWAVLSMADFIFTKMNEIVGALLMKDLQALRNRELEIIRLNESYTQGIYDGFRYHGKVYTNVAGNGRGLGKFAQLHSDLVPMMDQILKDRIATESDRQWIRQCLGIVLQGCHNDQDIRDALPNFLKDIAGVSHLQRTREEAWTLDKNPKLKEQYMSHREKMGFYIDARLLL
jgi:hypothetical protein